MQFVLCSRRILIHFFFFWLWAHWLDFFGGREWVCRPPWGFELYAVGKLLGWVEGVGFSGGIGANGGLGREFLGGTEDCCLWGFWDTAGRSLRSF